jgi:FkbM family methyltransferase
MLTFIRQHIKQSHNFMKTYNAVMRAFSSYQWQKHKWSDWLNTYVFKRTIQFDTPFGFKMVSRNYIANRMMMKGIFEMEEVELIKSTLKDSDVFVDVGANIGLYTCIARSLGKQAVAFEPQPHNLECLYTNLNNNNWQDTEVFPLGLSNKPGLLTLYGASGPSASLVSGWAGYSTQFKRIIPVNTLDTVLGDRFENKKLFIKIDVEGAEHNVLMGAVRTLSMIPRPTWFIEVCFDEFHPGAMNPHYEATFALFWKHGYEVRMANKEFTLITPGDIKSWVARKHSIPNHFNYLFIPK